ncbi:MFS transporter [Gordonia soli]|uniref:Putative drug resistance transporter n=1 Tax=Gordonia soli NBRC 108243 TaxID=1223545 RepID=M0QFS8_9ACTN|nr:MFS transporter [Gordonia soli]GAC67408.1 putative drug resistance transporter [Gordonia soli NBRC 108243]
MTTRTTASRQTDIRLVTILAVLFCCGWSANHFAAVLPVLADAEGLSRAVLNGAFGIYAIGLLPSLLIGGNLSDRLGRRVIVLTGATAAGLGNIAMAGWHDEVGIFVGRLVVGLGVGLAVSAGTAWTADVGGKRGAVLAGAILTSGFAIGPLASALIAQGFGTDAAAIPFAVAGALTLVSVAAGLRWASNVVADPTSPPDDGTEHPATGDRAIGDRGIGPALSWSIPMALWVFASVTVAIVTLAERLNDRYEGPLVPGIAAVVSLGSGVVIQIIARRLDWGPRSGVVGAALSAIGFALAAVGGAHPSLALFGVAAVTLGIAYGLCLRNGLVDVETRVSRESRGTVTGIFYVFTYVGFGLPVLLTTIEPWAGIVPPMLVLAGIAAAAATLRMVQISRRPTP